MKGLLIRLIVSAVALYGTVALAKWLNIGIEVSGASTVLIAVVVLAIINALIRPLVVTLTPVSYTHLTLPTILLV